VRNNTHTRQPHSNSSTTRTLVNHTHTLQLVTLTLTLFNHNHNHTRHSHSPTTATLANRQIPWHIVRSKRDEVRAEIWAATSELDALVNAPVRVGSDPRGDDPTAWLSNELMVAILLMLPIKSVFDCERVCRRWAEVVQSDFFKKRRGDRWSMYASSCVPRYLLEHNDTVCALATGPDGSVYSGSADTTIRAWRPAERRGHASSPLQTLSGHAAPIRALAVARDGTVISGSSDGVIGVWPAAECHQRMRTLEGHTSDVRALAVGGDGRTLFSGSMDQTVKVWSVDEDSGDAPHLCTLTGHTGGVIALAVGHTRGMVYSGSDDCSIRVWRWSSRTKSAVCVQTIVSHTGRVTALAVGADGRLYSGSSDKTIAVWSPGDDGSLCLEQRMAALVVTTVSVGKLHLGLSEVAIAVWPPRDEVELGLERVLLERTCEIVSLAVGPDGNVYSGSTDNSIRVWSAGGGGRTLLRTLLRTIKCSAQDYSEGVRALVFGHDGAMYSGSASGRLHVW
jgi:WD40 repeat protein